MTADDRYLEWLREHAVKPIAPEPELRPIRVSVSLDGSRTVVYEESPHVRTEEGVEQ
jgi:hypothetical protein